MRPSRFGQRIGLTFGHVHFNHAAGDQRKQLTAGFRQLFPVGDIALQRWAVTYREPFWFRIPRLTPVTGPEELPKLTIRPRRCRQSERLPGIFPYRVIDHGDFLTVGERFEPLRNRFFAIVNHLPGARRFGALRLLRAADGADKFRPSAFAH